MGSAIGKHLHKAMALLLAAAMALSLNPASALAQTNTSTDPQGNPSTYVAGENAAADAADDDLTAEEKRQQELDASVVDQQYSADAVATSASTTISMKTYASFRYTKLEIPAECLNKDSLKDQDLTASFDGGTPYANSGSTANSGAGSNAYYYTAHFEWTATGKDAQGNTWQQSGKLTDQIYGFATRVGNPTITLPVQKVYDQTPLPSNVEDARYVVTVQLEGSNGKTIPADFPSFTITKSEFTIYEVVSPQGEEDPAKIDARMTGLFASATKLERTDLMGGNLSATDKGTLAALQDLMKPQQMLAAAQLDLTNEELPSDKATYGSITNITMKVPADAAQQLVDKGTFTIGAVAGDTTTATYALNPAEGQTGPAYTFSPVGEGADGTLVATVTINDGYATVEFPAKGLTTKPGAFAIAVPVEADEMFTVQATATNGTMTNAGTAQYAQGAPVEFVLNPFEGYVIDESGISVTGAGFNNWELVGTNTLRLKDTSALTGTVVVNVVFQPYENPAPDQQQSFSVTASGVKADGSGWAEVQYGWVKIEGTDKDGAAVDNASSKKTELSDLKPGSQVKLTFNPAEDGVTVQNVWLVSNGDATGAGATPATDLAGVKDASGNVTTGSVQPISLIGNEHVIAALAENTRVVVQFAKGNPPATDSVTYDVNGIASPADGSQGEVLGVKGAVMGTNPTVAINAKSGYVISEARLYEGLFSTADDAERSGTGALIAAAEDKSEYKLTVPNITADMTVVAKFRTAPMQINVSTTESGASITGGTFSVSGATHAGGTRYNVEADAQVTFTAKADAGYLFTGVWVDGVLIAQGDLAGTTAEGGTFSVAFGKGATISPQFTPQTMPGPAEDLVSVVISTDGNGQVDPTAASIEQGGKLTLNFTTQGTFRSDAAVVSDGVNAASVALDGAASWVFDPASAELTREGLAADAGHYDIYIQFKDVPEQPVPSVKYSNVTLAAVGQGAISPQGTLNDAGERVYKVVSGVEQRLTLIPAEGYTLASVQLAEAGQTLAPVTATQAPTGTAKTPWLSGSTLVFTPADGKDYSVMVQFKKADATEARYTVVGSVDCGHGTISPSGTSEQLAGASIEFSFIPDADYKLESVQLTTAAGTDFDAAGAATTEVVSMVAAGKLPLTLTANTRVVARFAPLTEDEKKDPTDPNNPDNPDNPVNQPKMIVSPQAGEGGMIAPDTDQTVLATSGLSLSFTPYRGYELQDVTVACAELPNEGTLNRTVPLSVMAPNGAGSYSWTLKLDAAVVNQLKSLSGTAAIKVTANFKRQVMAYPITVFTQGPGQGTPQITDKSAAYGYVSPGFDTAGKVDVEAGGTASFMFVEQPGYVVDEVFVGTPGADGLPTAEQRVQGAVTSYDLVGVTGAKTLRVVYKQNAGSAGTTDPLYTVTASPAKPDDGAANPSHGYVSPWGKTEVAEGGSLTLTTQPDAGYKLGTLTVRGPNGTATVFDVDDESTFDAMSGSTYTLRDIAADYTVAATFVKMSDEELKEPIDPDPVLPTPGERADQTIFVSVTGPGMVTPGNVTADAPAQVKVPYNGTMAFSFIPDASDDENTVNRLAKIVVKRNGGLLTNEITNVGAGYIFQNVTADIQLEVVFEQVRKTDEGYEPKPEYKTYEMTAVAPAEGGTIEPAGITTVNEGASLAYTMRAAEGWHLSYVLVDRTAGNNGITVPASQLTNDQYLFANIAAAHSIQAVFVKDAAAGEDPADEVFTTFQTQIDDRAKAQADPSGFFSVVKGETVSLTLTPMHGSTITSVRVVDAVDPSTVLGTFTPAGGVATSAWTITLPCYEGHSNALVQVSTGTAGTATVEGPFYNVTASVAADAQGNKLGTISPSGTQSVKANSDVSFTLTPMSGCTVDTLTANGAPMQVKEQNGFYTATLHGVNGAMNVVAKFRQITQEEIDNGTVPEPGTPNTVTISSDGAGTVEPSGVQKIAPGLTLPITLKPTGSASLGTLVIDGVDVTDQVQKGWLDTAKTKPVYTYTIDPVRADMQVKATFVNPDGTVESTTNEIPVNVEVKVEVKTAGNVYGGCVEPGEPFTVNPGDSQTFKIKPANGFYVAEAYREEAGKTTQLQVRDWKPSYTTVTRAAEGAGASALAGVAGQVTEVAAVGTVSALLGVEQAWAAETVQMPYSAVDVNDIRQSFTLNVVLKKCSENGLPEYVYDKAAASEPSTRPDVSGNGTVKPSNGMETPDENGDVTYIIEPGVDANGEREDIENITINGVDIDLTDKNLPIWGPDGKQDPEKVVEYIKNLGVLKDGEDIKWVPEPAPGHYELTLKVHPVVDENGNPVVDENGNPVFDFTPPKVDFTGAGKAYSHEVRLVAKVVDEDGKPISGGAVTAQREDGASAKNGVLYMDYGGYFDFDVQLPEGEYELVGCDLDGALSFTERSAETSRVVALGADAGAADDGAGSMLLADGSTTPNRVFVYGPGTITANIRAVDKSTETYTVVASAGKGGSIDPSGTQTYAVGRDAQFTFSPESSAYTLDTVKVDGATLKDWKQFSYTFTDCKAGSTHTIEVTFKATPSQMDPGSSTPDSQNPLTTAKRTLKSLQSLATTGDNGYIMVLTLAALACGGLGFAIIATGRTRRKAARAAADAAALTEDVEE